MVYGSVEYMNDKNKQCRHRAFPGLFVALYICNSDLRRRKKAGGGVVWRSEQQPEQSPNCQNHVVVKFFHPRGFDSWRGWLLLASTTWELSEPRGAMMRVNNRTMITIVDNHWPPSQQASLPQVACCVNDLREITRMLPTSSQAQTQNLINAMLI